MPPYPLTYGLSLAKTRADSFTPLAMLQASAQAVDFKVGRHFGFWRGTGLSLPWPKHFLNSIY